MTAIRIRHFFTAAQNNFLAPRWGASFSWKLNPAVAKNAPRGANFPAALRAKHAGGVLGKINPGYAFFAYPGNKAARRTAPRRRCEDV
jgi:hypothetical protein